jgi:DNA-binding Lrp family transcriptional regulator
MPKNGKISIEADEQKIIDQLVKDSRQSPHEIAKKLGFSRQKVWRIIKKLEKDKIIWGYTTVVDENSIEYNTYYALVKSKGLLYEVVDKLVKRIQEKNSEKMGIKLLGAVYINGTFDWLVIFSAKDIMDAKKFTGYILKEYGNNTVEIELLESVFTLLRFGKINPDIDKIRKIAVF